MPLILSAESNPGRRRASQCRFSSYGEPGNIHSLSLSSTLSPPVSSCKQVDLNGAMISPVIADFEPLLDRELTRRAALS